MNKPLGRRDILKGMGACALAAGMISAASGCSKAETKPGHKVARYWSAGKEKTVDCGLCPQSCTTKPGETGFCKARRNIDGKYYSLTYGHPVAIHNDPVEKKPFNHVLPGTKVFSIGLTGCNLRCKHCQNWQLSQADHGSLRLKSMEPDALVAAAKANNSSCVAFTYNEPTTFTEYMIDSASAAKKAGVGAIIISNGYINQEPQRDLLENLTAYKVDLKGFSEKFYSDICGASLKPVLDSMQRIKKQGMWLEIVNLMIPTLNDNEKELNDMAKWVVANLGKDVPIHFTRFHPMYKLRNLPPTPVATLEKAREIATSHGVRYAYTGNVPGHKWGNTYCHQCGNLLIKRYGYTVDTDGMENGKCKKCKAEIPGVWKL